MIIVGLTGGIGTGKSAVSAALEESGVAVIDGDVISRQIVEPGSRALKAITRHFGNEILDERGFLDRAKLGEIVFSDPRARKRLNSITHPAIFYEIVNLVGLFTPVPRFRAVASDRVVFLAWPLLRGAGHAAPV
eukprot:c14294_g1_i3.p1 GENE.c14294_g1_i3~~c14294_g1_i3.p1  ORF type:complete len:134 (+),score=18.38 c14294_g1_i3:35-436(+)